MKGGQQLFCVAQVDIKEGFLCLSSCNKTREKQLAAYQEPTDSIKQWLPAKSYFMHRLKIVVIVKSTHLIRLKVDDNHLNTFYCQYRIMQVV